MQTTKTATAVAKKVNKSKAPVKAKAVSTKPKLKLDPVMVKKAKVLISKLQGNGIDAPGLIKQILQLYTNGFTCAQIIAYGFNKSTVYRQTRELNKLRSLHAKKQVTSKAVTALKGTN